MPAKWTVLPITALALNIGAGQSMTVVTDGVSFPCTGKEIILMKGGAGSHVITATSRVDPYNRTGDIVYTLGIGLMAVLPQLQPAGFSQSTGLCIITSDGGGTDVLFWCLRLTD
jgi:hypothetical protein